MNKYLFFTFLFTGLVSFSQLDAQDDWARWRGPTGNGLAAEGQTPPTQWSKDENVVWKSKVPGEGHASPIVVDNKIFLATADKGKQTQSVLCYDRTSGDKVWETKVSQGGFPRRIHPKNTHASPTIATDRKHLFVVFNNHDRVQLAALDFEGKQVWQEEVGPFVSKYPFGFGSSPIVYDDKVIVANLNKKQSGITAYAVEDGEQLWKIERPAGTNYATPVVATVDGKKQLLLSGTRKIFSFDPDNGEERWVADAKWDITCATMVWNDDLVFASGGYPPNQTLAVKADGSGEVVWQNGIKVYEQSMLYLDGYLYAHSENGGLYCWQASDGKEMWKRAFGSRKNGESASPVHANGNIYFTDEKGETLVIKANPKNLEEVSRNKLGDSSFASFAVCGNQIFTRVAFREGGKRQEWLICLGKE